MSNQKEKNHDFKKTENRNHDESRSNTKNNNGDNRNDEDNFFEKFTTPKSEQFPFAKDDFPISDFLPLPVFKGGNDSRKDDKGFLNGHDARDGKIDKHEGDDEHLEHLPLDPNAPAVDPNAPVVDPNAPAVDPNAPVVDPNAPVVDPNAPVVDPNAPVVDPNAPVVIATSLIEIPIIKNAPVLKPTNGDDLIEGKVRGDKINGGDGNDIIFGFTGNDNLKGGNGNDIINGGVGRDVLSGGNGEDVFEFTALDSSANKSGRDVIKDFKSGVDKIDLTGFENILDFVSKADLLASDDASDMVWFQKGVLYVSTDADIAPEFAIELSGVKHFTAEDLII
jgi:hypothetical protein